MGLGNNTEGLDCFPFSALFPQKIKTSKNKKLFFFFLKHISKDTNESCHRVLKQYSKGKTASHSK